MIKNNSSQSTVSVNPKKITKELLAWGRLHGRKDLPWQNQDPYRIWISEIMLQQTQVETVKRYFEPFIRLFPTLSDLAQATEEAVLSAWKGLGFYGRARRLRLAAILAHESGGLPTTSVALADLPGMGRSTANAVASLGYGERVPIFDGNAKRWICRVLGFDPKKPGEPAWEAALNLMPTTPDLIRLYAQTSMDFGALVCKPVPDCTACPLRQTCLFNFQGLKNNVVEKRQTKEKRKLTLDWVILLDPNPPSLWLKNAGSSLGFWENLWVFPSPDDLGEERVEGGFDTQMDWELSHRQLTIRLYFRALRSDLLHQELDPPLSLRQVQAKDFKNLPFPTPVLLALKKTIKGLAFLEKAGLCP